MVFIEPLDDDSRLTIPQPDPAMIGGEVFGGLIELDPPNTNLRVDAMKFYGDLGYQVRWIDTMPVGISDDGYPMEWLVVYMEER